MKKDNLTIQIVVGSFTVSMGLLTFALLGINLLGWPVIALCYPLFASVWAVETGSRYHMRKMVEYWTLFSLFSLFEFAFVKIIEWIPFWSGVRLAVGLLLVMPQFEGAGIAYQGLVRSFIHRFGILKEERFRKRKACLNAVEKFIEENGSEALEKLIVSQMTPPEARVPNRHPETFLPNKSEQEWTCNFCEITGVGESMLNAHLRGSMHKSKLEFLRANDTSALPVGTHAAAEFKGRMPPKEPESSHLNKAWQEWSCDLCKVTTASKSMLNAHLQGIKHKSKLESLKASLLEAKDTGPFARLHMEPVSEAEEIMPPKETAEARLETPLKKAQPEWTGDVCKVTTESESMSNDHIQGSQHKSKLGTTLKASLLEAKDTGPSSLHMQPVSAFEEEEKMPPKEIAEKGLPETPILEKAQREWTSDRCKATNENESMLFDFLQESNQKSKLETILEASLSFAKDTLCLFKVKNAERKWTCDLCNVITSSEITLNSHLQGRKHMDKFVTTMKQSLLELEKLTVSKTGHVESEVEYEQSNKVPERTGDNPEAKETLPSREASCEETPPLKKEWSCGFCKVKCLSKKHLNAHLLGRKHKSKLELLTTREGKLVVLQVDGKFNYWCILCAAKLPNDLSLASHVGGKRHASNIDEHDDKLDI